MMKSRERVVSMKKQLHVITAVEPGSIAEECGLEPGDRIAEINGNEIEDIFDYQYYIQDEFLNVLVLTKDDEECMLEIEKEEDEDLGILFESSLMDEYHSCCNKCIFCFIDQMPPGMRETLYFKDDDSRLSFLQGNYITLTNMKEKDLDRIIRYHLAPINISVHTTNPELRCQMLHNRFAGDIMDKIRRLADAEIPMNSQIVLCKGINDGEELDRTIRELGDFLPFMESLSVVPVGLTKYRENLYNLEEFTKEDAAKVLEQIHGWQEHFKETRGTSFVHASDEWFILAGQDFPSEEYYEGYGQLENGVGMMRLLITEVENRLEELEGDSRKRKVSIATAKLAYPTIVNLARKIQKKYPGIEIHVYCIMNHFFGEKVTVSGLLTGQDIIAKLKEQELGDVLFLPANVLKADEDIFLDDISLKELSDSLQVPVNIIQSEGEDFVNKIIDTDLR
ncbi:MAG: DUF512 domain-containing protein [Lachnospiraceae bacterium]|nr:DUF512 domain-containing protein [Lachnospiraceae bacterium]